MKKGVKVLIVFGSIIFAGAGGIFGFILYKNLKVKPNEAQWKEAFSYIHDTQNRSVELTIRAKQIINIYCVKEKETAPSLSGKGAVYAKIDTDGKPKRYDKDSKTWVDGSLFTNDYDYYMPSYLKDIENNFNNFKFSDRTFRGNNNGTDLVISFASKTRLASIEVSNDSSLNTVFDYNVMLPEGFPD